MIDSRPRTMRWAAGVVVLAVLGTGCERGGRGAQPTPRPTPTSPGATTPPSDTRQVVAVTSTDGSLALFRVDAAGRRVTDRLPLNGPQGAKSTSVSLSGGAAPTVCAVWTAAQERNLLCYAPGASDGVTVAAAATTAPSRVGVSASGRSVAWVRSTGDDDADSYNQDILVGRLGDDATVTEVRTLPARPPGSPPAMLGPSADDIAWRGDDALVISTGFQSDDGTGLTDVTVEAAARGGWSSGRMVYPPPAERRAGFAVFELVRTPTAGETVVAVQRGSYGAGDAIASRAVVVDLTTGATRRVIALAAAERDMVGSSGSDRGWVYQTGGNDLRTYFRLPTEERGQPLTGLPAGADLVLAQP